MTFARMLILAITTATLVHAFGVPGDRAEFVLWTLLASYVAWSFTTDPLPGAIERGLDHYAKKWRGQ
jgi:hypothetical protein